MNPSPAASLPVLSLLALALAACSTSPSSSASSPAAPVAAPMTPVSAPTPMSKPAAPAQPAATVAASAAPATVGTIDFDMQVKPFFAKYCYACHDVNGKAAGIGFDTKSGILQTVTPGNADDSLLYNVLASRKMPQGRNKPTPAEIDVIKVWINEGAKVSDSIPASS